MMFSTRMSIKVILIIKFAIIVIQFKSSAQVGIGTIQPNKSSILDVYSKTKGFLPPRLNKGQRNGISNPAEGLTIYCTDCCNQGVISFYNGNEWILITKNCIADSDSDGIIDTEDLDKDNDGIIDSNEIENKVLLTNTFGHLPVNSSCYITTLSAPSYSNIPAQHGSMFGQANITDGHYNVVSSTQCAATWASGSPVTSDATNTTLDNGEVGYFVFVNAPHVGGEIVYGQTINAPKNSVLEVKLSIVNIVPSNSDKPNLKIRLIDQNTLATIDSNETGDINNGNWQEYKIKVETKDISLIDLQIINNCSCGASGNDFGIDDVIVTVKYSDLDNDGLQDGDDQDSDGDGIPDIIEMQGNTSLLFPIGLDSDNDGLDDAFETNGLINPIDTDGDGNPDYLDTDSDNDGILDKDETGKILSGYDTDEDGLDNAMDISTNHSSPGGIYHTETIKDSDNNGIPDYRQP